MISYQQINSSVSYPSCNYILETCLQLKACARIFISEFSKTTNSGDSILWPMVRFAHCLVNGHSNVHAFSPCRVTKNVIHNMTCWGHVDTNINAFGGCRDIPGQRQHISLIFSHGMWYWHILITTIPNKCCLLQLYIIWTVSQGIDLYFQASMPHSSCTFSLLQSFWQNLWGCPQYSIARSHNASIYSALLERKKNYAGWFRVIVAGNV